MLLLITVWYRQVFFCKVSCYKNHLDNSLLSPLKIFVTRKNLEKQFCQAIAIMLISPRHIAFTYYLSSVNLPPILTT